MADAGSSDWPRAGRASDASADYVTPHYMPAPESDGMDMFRKLWRRKMLILSVAAVGGTIAGLATLTMTPRYAAEARVLIGVQLPNISKYPGLLQDTAADQQAIQSESYVMTSRSLLTQVAYRMALANNPEFAPWLKEPSAWRSFVNGAKSGIKDGVREILNLFRNSNGNAGGAVTPSAEEIQQRRQAAVVSNVQNRIEVSPLQRSHVLSIQAESETPETAARLANTVARTYIEQQMVRRTQVGEGASEWLTKRVAELRAKVEEAERAAEEYRRAHGLYETKNNRITAQQVETLNTQLVMAESEKASVEAKLAQIEQAKKNRSAIASLPSVVDSPLIQSLLQRKIDAEREAAELGATFGPQHPRIRNIKAQLADIRGRIDQEVTKILQAVRHEADAVRARVETLRSSLSGLENRLGDENENSIKLRELERQAEADRRLLVDFLDRAKETEALPNAGEQSSVIISEATLPYAKSYPPTTMLILLGIIGGGLLGMISALLRENLDRTFRTARQVEEATNLPVIGMLPSLERGTVGQLAPETGTAYDHAMGTLLERLVFAPETQARKILTLTSATPREGKTRLAVELVHRMARRGLKVIILDCDWRRPSINRYFGRASAPGLGDLLAGTATPDEVVYKDPDSGAHAIFAGDISLLQANNERFYRFRLLQTTLARHYDLVIVDTPPVLAGPESLAFSRMSEEVTFVVRWGHTTQDVTREAIRKLVQNGARFGGIVLSDINRQSYRRYGSGDLVYPYATPRVPKPI